MKLHDVPRRSIVRLLENARIPPVAASLKKGDVLFFDHIDGMYSLCKFGKEIVHPAAWTEVEVIP